MYLDLTDCIQNNVNRFAINPEYHLGQNVNKCTVTNVIT